MLLDHIRLSEQAREQLIKLKRFTGIQQWNVLCRWAFCVSLAEEHPPAPSKIPADSNVEMTWRTFGGTYSEVYLALLRQRCRQDGLDPTEETLALQFRLHLHRGIAYLASNRRLRNISDLYSYVKVRDRSDAAP